MMRQFLGYVSGLVLGLASCLLPGGPVAAAEGGGKIVTLGAAVTEIVFELGEGARIIGRDRTSTYPPAALELPDVGYVRALSAEGVLALGPELILASEGAGPPDVIGVLKQAGIKYVVIPEGLDAEAVARKITMVGEALGVEARAQALARKVTGELEAAAAMNAQTKAKSASPKRAMFVMSSKGGKLNVAGRNTPPDAIIRMAGGVNAITEFDLYKPISDEAAAAAAPDLILMMTRGGDHAATAEELFALPSLVTTPAARDMALVKVDGAKFFGFGPRVGEVVRDLAAHLNAE